jgi:hypothetical protein
VRVVTRLRAATVTPPPERLNRRYSTERTEHDEASRCAAHRHNRLTTLRPITLFAIR